MKQINPAPTLRQSLEKSIKESRENIAYWTRQKVLALNPKAKAEAGARVLLWQGNLNVHLEKYAALSQPAKTLGLRLTR